MKVAVIADIHGFSIALERVLDSIREEGVIDRIIAAGDLCEGGPDPAGVLRILREQHIESVQGNTDRDLANGSRGSRTGRWIAEQIGRDGLTRLGSLPFDVRLTPSGAESPRDDLLVVHANPRDQDQHLAPAASDAEVQNIIGTTKAAVIAFGHLHIAYIRVLERLTLIDVSAVGNPKDEDLRSKWGLVSWDPGPRSWRVELRYVDYPVEQTLHQIEASGIPNPQKVIGKLLRASYDD